MPHVRTSRRLMQSSFRKRIVAYESQAFCPEKCCIHTHNCPKRSGPDPHLFLIRPPLDARAPVGHEAGISSPHFTYSSRHVPPKPAEATASPARPRETRAFPGPLWPRNTILTPPRDCHRGRKLLRKKRVKYNRLRHGASTHETAPAAQSRLASTMRKQRTKT